MGLKRIEWRLGQPLLPLHLTILEDSVRYYAYQCRQSMGIPFYGYGAMKWDSHLLSGGVVSINQLRAVFPSGHIIEAKENGEIQPFDLNASEKQNVSLYLHLKDERRLHTEMDVSGIEQIHYGIYKLAFSEEASLPDAIATLRFADFERSAEKRWSLSENYIPPCFEVSSNPFLKPLIDNVRSSIDRFQEKLIPEDGTFQSASHKVRSLIKEVAQFRRLLINMERGALTHPYFFYEGLCQLLDAALLIHSGQLQTDLDLVAYEHEALGDLFKMLMEKLDSLLDYKAEKISSISFVKKGSFYVLEKLPSGVRDAEEIYLVVEPLGSLLSPSIEGIKLSSLSRLPNTVRFALKGIGLVQVQQVPFEHNFSKKAQKYSLNKGAEWELAIEEGKLGLSSQEISCDLQVSLYWR